MKLNYKGIAASLITTGLILLNTPVYASENELISIDTIFNEEQGLWYPGRIESKDFYIGNNNSNNITIDRLYIELESCEHLKTGEILDIKSKEFKQFAKNSTVTLKHGNTILFKDKLYNLLSEKGINLSKEIDIKSNNKELFNMTIDMDLEMNNDAENLKNIFKIGVAYKMNEDTIISPEKPNNNDNLPQTGSLVSSFTLITLGAIGVGLGMEINRKSGKKGGKRHE